MNVAWRSASRAVGVDRDGWEGWHINPNQLTQEQQRRLVDALYPVAMSAFRQADSPGFYEDVSAHILHNSDLLVYNNEHAEAVAFRMWDIMQVNGRPVVYLAGMCVHTDYQRHGIGKLMLAYVVDCSDKHYPDWSHMVLRTQNPVMQRCFRGVVSKGTLFQFGDASIPLEVQSVASEVAQKIKDGHFDSTKLVSRGVYGSSLYGDDYAVVAKSIGTNFANLNQRNGDAAYCVWQKEA